MIWRLVVYYLIPLTILFVGIGIGNGPLALFGFVLFCVSPGLRAEGSKWW